MRIAVVSDIHGNLAALEAVLADLAQASPDQILHGGDLAHGGSSPAEVVDCIRDLGWPGVVGNTDEMLFRPEALTEFMGQRPHLQPLWAAIREMGSAACDALGPDRLAWLSNLPRSQVQAPMALVHASPESLWISPGHDASDADLNAAYSSLNQRITVYGHIHHPYIRSVGQVQVINTGSVSLSYDGDPRATYLLLDDWKPEIRRVAYDVERERKAIFDRKLPRAEWIAKILNTAQPQMP